MRQVLTDRTMLRSMHAEAKAARNYTEMHFCDALLALIAEVLPDNHQPSGLELSTRVMTRAYEPVMEPNETEEFLGKLGELVEALKVCAYLC
jgi:hypothetical protein